GQIFLLNNADLVFICKGGEVAAIDEAVTRLRHLFQGDPLAQNLDIEEESRFCTWYDLEDRYEDFVAVAQQLLAEEERRCKRLAAMSRPSEPAVKPILPPLNPSRLGELVDALSRADLSNMMRRQAVCRIEGEAPPKPMFRELYISIDELREIVMPDYDVARDRWLFQHLTQTLDNRMLQLLRKNDDRAIGAYSVNINVATLLSERFLAFDAALGTATRRTIIFELQLIDIFADLPAFLFARDFVKERGYRVCLDGATDLTIAHIDRAQLGLDLIKIIWRPEMIASGMERIKALYTRIAAFGRARTILCRCGGEDAVKVGQELGIGLFQGRYVDRLLESAGAANGTRKAPAAGRQPMLA
ncbi:MAG: hypothetical protein JO010_05695, partial [Alphaproteobacteria bacterium]|nr:hypothetical protein [Alphaproteobacteria bacterium]